MSLSDGDTKETVGRARKSEVIRSNNATVSGAGEHGPTCDRCGDHLTVERKHLHSESKSLSGTAPVVSGGEGQSFPMRGTKHHLPRRNEGFSRLHRILVPVSQHNIEPPHQRTICCHQCAGSEPHAVPTLWPGWTIATLSVHLPLLMPMLMVKQAASSPGRHSTMTCLHLPTWFPHHRQGNKYREPGPAMPENPSN